MATIQEIPGDVTVQGQLEALGGIGVPGSAEFKTPTEVATANVYVAQGDISNLQLVLANMSADDKLTPQEKRPLLLEWEKIEQEYPIVIDQAEASGIIATDAPYVLYDQTFDALDVYLFDTGGILVDMTTTSDIVGAVFRAKFTDYFEARQLLFEAIQAKQPTKAEVITGFTGGGGTLTPTAPTLAGSCFFTSAILVWNHQIDLTGQITHEIHRATTLSGEYTLLATVTGYTYDDANLALEGTAGSPTAKNYYYKIKRVVNGTTKSDFSNTVTLIANPIPEGSLAVGSVSTDKLTASSVTAGKIDTTSLATDAAFIASLVADEAFITNLAAQVIQFQQSVGSLTAAEPEAGDLIAYMGKDPRRPADTARVFELALKQYVGDNGGAGYTEEWQEMFKTKQMGNVFGMVLAGALMACGGVQTKPGSVWKLATHPFYLNPTWLAYGNGVVIGLGNASGTTTAQIARSTDGGVTWSSLITNPFGTSLMQSVEYGNGVWIATSEGGKIARSTDGGVTWSSLITNPFGTSTITSIKYGNGIWIAIASPSYIARSTDGGVTWSSLITNPFDDNATSTRNIEYGNGVWIAIASDASSPLALAIVSTDDGVSWASVSHPVASTQVILIVRYANGIWLMTDNASNIFRSTDGGVTWSSAVATATMFGAGGIYALSYGDGVWIAGSYTGKIGRSFDNGLTWTEPGNTSTYLPFTYNWWQASCYAETHKRFVFSMEAVGVAYTDWIDIAAWEKGSNANGEFLKTPFGITLQWGKYAISAASWSGGPWSTSPYYRLVSVAYPIDFGSVPKLSQTLNSGSSFPWLAYSPTGASRTVSGFSQYIFDSENAASLTMTLDWIAIGPSA